MPMVSLRKVVRHLLLHLLLRPRIMLLWLLRLMLDKRLRSVRSRWLLLRMELLLLLLLILSILLSMSGDVLTEWLHRRRRNTLGIRFLGLLRWVKRLLLDSIVRPRPLVRRRWDTWLWCRRVLGAADDAELCDHVAKASRDEPPTKRRASDIHGCE